MGDFWERGAAPLIPAFGPGFDFFSTGVVGLIHGKLKVATESISQTLIGWNQISSASEQTIVNYIFLFYYQARPVLLSFSIQI